MSAFNFLGFRQGRTFDASFCDSSAAIAAFIEFYNHQRYHQGIENIAPADAYFGRRGGILKRREEQGHVTLEKRFRCNRSRSKKTITGALRPKQ